MVVFLFMSDMVCSMNHSPLSSCYQVTQLPEKDELSWSKKQLLAKLDVCMGGRVAEEIVFGSENITSGKRFCLSMSPLPRPLNTTGN